jgi:hypothetical protein
MFEKGAEVEVQDESENWYPATVKQAWYGLHYISYSSPKSVVNKSNPKSL